ncbi:MAG: TlpA family protein disulfide reductase [Fimbriimonadaceae bacterium]|nr:TlpA family protein disulfide reductase [Fimbriimonadaceae bacterium]QYK55185.1 MAG: TlpA family protein disulfide reductase [Fimbriimonadaceae bacterium]
MTLAALALLSLRPDLKFGMPAPPLQPFEWVGGSAPSLGAKPRVVFFWATWCPYCRQSLPVLRGLKERYRDRVDFIALNVRDQDKESPDSSVYVSRISAWVKWMGQLFPFQTGIDGPRKEVQAAYLDASGSQGVPAAFVMDAAGTFVWRGHPMDRLGEVLERVLAGAWTATDALAREAEEKGADQHVKALVTEAGNALAEGKREKAAAIVKAGAETVPAWLQNDFRLAWLDAQVAQGSPAAWSDARSLVEGPFAEKPEYLYLVGVTILRAPAIAKDPDYGLAARALHKSFEANGGWDAPMLAQAAEAAHMAKNKGDAVAWQKRVVQIYREMGGAADPRELPKAERALARYEQAGG